MIGSSSTDDIPPVTTEQESAIVPPLIKNILLVNSAVFSLNAYTNSETLVFGYENTYTTDDLLPLFRTTNDNMSSVNRIGFAFHYSAGGSTSIPLFINQEPFFTDSDLGESVETYSRNVQFMLDLLKGFTHVDFLACDTLLDYKWRQYYNLLQSKTGAVVGASDNNTGSLKYGGDWVMESTYEDVGQIYFIPEIENWASLLAIPTGLNTYYHTFYTVDATDLTIMTRRIYNNTGTLLDTQDISYGGLQITTALATMDGGGTNPYMIGIVDASLNKARMDIAFCGIYKNPFTTTQMGKLMTYVNTTYKEPHTNMTAIYTVTVSGGVFVCKNSSNAVVSVPISLSGGYVYMFDQSNSTNSGSRPFTLSSSSTALTAITTGLVVNSTPGILNAYTIVSPSVNIFASINFFYVKVVLNQMSVPVFSLSTSLNGTYYNQPKLTFLVGNKYTFFVSDTSVTGYTLVFGTAVENKNFNLYTTSGVAGAENAYVLLDVSAGYSGTEILYFDQTTSGMGYYPFVSSTPATPDKVWLKFERGDIVGVGVKDYVSNTFSGTTSYYTTAGGSGHTGIALTDISNITSYSGDYLIGNSALYLKNNQRIKFGSSGSQGKTLTMSVWIKLKIAPDNTVAGPLFFYGPNDGWYGANSIYLEIGSTGNISSWINNSQASLLNTSSIRNGNWHHMCIVIGISFTTIYFDNTVVRQISSSPINTSASYIYRYILGANHFTGKSFTGYVDDFRMYTNAFSTTEVAGLYNYRDKEVLYTVTVVGSVVYLDGLAYPDLTFAAGKTYIFYQSDSSNASNQIVFSIVPNRNPRYSSTDGVTIVGTPGQVGAYTKLVLSSGFTGSLYSSSIANMVYYYTVSVTGGVYWISTNGATAVTQPMVNFVSGYTYIFDQSHSSNAAKPLGLTLHAGFPTNSTIYSSNLMTSAAYTTGVVTTGTPGTSGSSLQITVDDNTPQPMYYYCTNPGALMGYIPPLAIIKYTFDISDGIVVANSGTSGASGNGEISYRDTDANIGAIAIPTGTSPTCSYNTTIKKKGSSSLYNRVTLAKSSCVKVGSVALSSTGFATFCYWANHTIYANENKVCIPMSFETSTIRNDRPYDVALFNQNGSTNELLMNVSNSNRLNYFDRGSKTFNQTFSNVWAHIAITVNNSTGETGMYCNGSKTVATFQRDSTTWGSLNTTRTFLIFSGGGTPGTLSMQGYIDDYRIYNVKLSDAEIMSIYQNENYNF